MSRTTAEHTPRSQSRVVDDDGRAAGGKHEAVARLAGRAVFYGSLLLVALSAVPYGSIEPWWANLFASGVFALGALWALESLLAGGLRLSRAFWPLLLPPLALAAFAFLQTIPLARDASDAGRVVSALRGAISADPFETYNFALRLLALTLLCAMLLRFTTSRRRLTAVVLTVVCVGALSALFGIIRQGAQGAEMGFVLPSLPRGIGYGQIISRNQFAFMMEMALGLSLGVAAARAERHASSLFYLSLALPAGAALILANSRGGILTLLCQLLFVFALAAPAWTNRRDARRARGEARSNARGLRRRAVSLAARAVAAAALVGLVSVAVVWVGGERVVSNLSTVGEELAAQDEAASTRWNTRRVDIWRATWEMFKDHPVAGVGMGGYWVAIPQYHDASGEYTPQQAHNDYLELLASGGVFGSALFLCFLFFLLKRARATLHSGDPFRRAATLGALAGLFGVAVHSLFDFGLHLTANAALFVLLVAAAAADATGDERL
ncbi:MAG TPA: O-antigen ligase family protein [Pyrinomonadaceae bacterium]|nr:O-antigen ligase family protein [Pyrinomonadaceae bacterium]